MEEFEFYRRHLPHWRAQSVIYFVTWRLDSRQAPLVEQERTVVADALRFFHRERYALIAFVIMDDHVHVLVHFDEQSQLRTIVHTWKSFTSNKLQRQHGRNSSVWQNESFDRIVRDAKELDQIQHYIAGNPAKRWPESANYRWYERFDDPGC